MLSQNAHYSAFTELYSVFYPLKLLWMHSLLLPLIEDSAQIHRKLEDRSAGSPPLSHSPIVKSIGMNALPHRNPPKGAPAGRPDSSPR